ncbi:MAG TPA: aromatic amino acid lyase, partial [Syntrophobacteria bacterium]|nr:aromatic amino acid lyase [Syntrophobacteria bacterium]
MREIMLGVEEMTLEHLVAIAREGARVRLSEESEELIRASRKLVEQWVQQGRIVYGITTGFGALSDVTISRENSRSLQENVLMSHAAGVGDILDEETVRAVIALRIKDLARGHSGIGLATVHQLMEL